MPRQPSIHIEPAASRLDETLAVRLTGLGAGAVVTVRSRIPGPGGQNFDSYATFRADPAGEIDLTSQAPLEGSYTGVDPMGLIWSMRSDPAPAPQADGTSGLDPVTVRFAAEVNGQEVAVQTCERFVLDPGVRRTEVREGGLVASLFTPNRPGRYPGVMILTGSSGGFDESGAALLAAQGYAALALAYFAKDGLPAQLFQIPLEYFEQAIAWMQAHPAVDGSRLGVMGWSRGGELSLLLGSTFPQFRAVVAVVASGQVWQGMGRSVDGVERDRPAWTWRGEPLPYVPRRFPPDVTDRIRNREPITMLSAHVAALENRSAVEQATIPVERIRGGLLLISGQDDQTWPSTMLSDWVVERLERHRHPYPYRHLAYPGAGHSIWPLYVHRAAPPGPRYHPVRQIWYNDGGSPAADANARQDGWRQVLAFLTEHLG